MLHDELAMNKATGEVLPATKAIYQYYTVEKHGCLDNWLDEWELTGLEADSFIGVPNFSNVF